MRPQRTAGRSWVSRLARTAFALTTVVIVPVAVTARVLSPERLLRPRYAPAIRDLQKRHDAHPTLPEPEWPALDPPMTPRSAPLQRGPFLIDPGPFVIDPEPARKRN